MTVDADDRERRLQPQSSVQGQRRIPDELRPGADAERAGKPPGRVVEAGDGFELGIGERPHIVGGAAERERPVLVDQRRQDACEGEHRIGYGTARHARVHGTVERAHLYVGGGEAA